MLKLTRDPLRVTLIKSHVGCKVFVNDSYSNYLTTIDCLGMFAMKGCLLFNGVELTATLF